MRGASFNQQRSWDTHNQESTQACNSCIIIPANVTVYAQALQKRGHSWSVQTNLAGDLTVHVGGDNFHLHKLPLASRSKYLNGLIFQRTSSKDTNHGIHIQMVDLPGGIEAFKSVVEFCYGLPVHLTASNIAPIYCAAHFLEMTEDMEEGNLISKTEAFLSFAMFSSWHDTIAIFRSCETLSSWPQELHISKRCCESISWKVCIDPHTISFIHNDNGSKNSSHINAAMIEHWWFEDVTALRIDHFVDAISAIKAKAMSLELVAACIMHWAAKSFQNIEMRINASDDNNNHVSAIESLIKLLPKGLISFNFLLRLLKLGLILNINQELVKDIEKRVVDMLESCSVGDLMVKNNGVENDSNMSCDVDIVRKVIESYIAFRSCNPGLPKMAVVAGTVDAYLAMVARDANLSAETFRSLAAVFPENTRHSDDSLYTAIDTYLKARPHLTEEERKQVCQAMKYQKLSIEVRAHALQNERLPLSVRIRYLLIEHVFMARSILTLEERPLEFPEELQNMKEQIEKMKAQLSDIQIIHSELNKVVSHKSNQPWNLRRNKYMISMWSEESSKGDVRDQMRTMKLRSCSVCNRVEL